LARHQNQWQEIQLIYRIHKISEVFPMLTQNLVLQNKDSLEPIAARVDKAEMALLMEWLKEKDDTIRYATFTILRLVSARCDLVYHYWDTFAELIDDPNSYQRSIGLILISENIRWDSSDKFGKICSNYLKHCEDEKFITARQCIQGLTKIVDHTQKYRKEILDMLLGIDLESKKDTQVGLLLLDIVEVLGELYEEQPEERIENYLKKKYEFAQALGNDKVRKKIKAILGMK
jgi:hypothetical protein